MTHSFRGAHADMHTHSHSGDCEEELSGKYTTYIKEHRDLLIAKCERVNDCIDGLLEDENILLLLTGDNLSLNRTCGLVFDDNLEDDVDLGKCTAKDRDDIHDDLQNVLDLEFEDAKATWWKNVKRCLDGNFGKNDKSTHVKDICMLAKKKPQICENRILHKNVTTFFNNHIQHLQCACKSLHTNESNETKSRVPIVVGCLVGGLILLLLMIAIYFIYRRRKKAKKSKKASNVIYLPAPMGENYPIYQELGDDKNYPGYGRYPAGSPPTLPLRYGEHSTGQEDENAYLEPVEAGFKIRPKAPFPGKSNPHYGAPPEYSELDASNNVTTDDKKNGYFQPLPNSPKSEPENVSGYETIGAEMLDEEETPRPPVPAKRSRSGNEEIPRYVVLEKDGDIKKFDSTV